MITLPPTHNTIEEALATLRRGGCIAHATETCYGFACDLTNPEAVARLFAIKKRPVHQPVSALFQDIATVKRYVVWSDRVDALAQKHLPGPLTLILPLQPTTPYILHPIPTSNQQPANQKPTIGLRLSSHPLAQELAVRFGRPLSTTSANIHGEPNPYDAQGIADRFATEAEQPDLIIDSGTLPTVPPSTVIDLTGDMKTLRQGAFVFPLSHPSTSNEPTSNQQPT